MVEEVKERMQQKTNDELLSIWTKNDREQWSDDAFEAVKQVLTDRNITIPVQNPPPKVQRNFQVGQQLKQLPDIPIRKAIRIERNFAVWSVLLALWLFFGFFQIFHNFQEMKNYRTALSNLKMASSPSVSVKPEFAEAVERLKPHIPVLENLQSYLLLGAIIQIPAWITIFPVGKKFIQRKKQGPTYLLILLAVWFAVDTFGALLTIPIPMAKTMDFVDIFQIRIYPVVRAIIMLTLTPFFGKTATVFYQYTAVDSECFRKNGVGLDVLSKRQEWPSQLSSLAVWSLILCLFPYVGLPMAICAVRTISKSEGRLYGKKLAWASVMVNGLVLAIMIFGITMGVFGGK